MREVIKFHGDSGKIQQIIISLNEFLNFVNTFKTGILPDYQIRTLNTTFSISAILKKTLLLKKGT